MRFPPFEINTATMKMLYTLLFMHKNIILIIQKQAEGNAISTACLLLYGKAAKGAPFVPYAFGGRGRGLDGYPLDCFASLAMTGRGEAAPPWIASLSLAMTGEGAGEGRKKWLPPGLLHFVRNDGGGGGVAALPLLRARFSKCRGAGHGGIAARSLGTG